jgi:RNAse (barnase) inhibitor barstar
MSAFIFTDQAKVDALHRAELPPGIKNEEALLDALSVALRFPDYFGRNWDALDECICDLSWLPPGDVVLVHKDLPLADNRGSLSIYLSILKDALGNWSAKGSNLIYASPEKRDATGERKLLANRKFFVTFPPDTQSSVESVLASSGGSGT